MSGRAKRILYRIIELLLVLVAAAGVFFMFYQALKADILRDSLAIAGCAVGFVLLLPVAIIVLHELGHLIFGLVAGLRFYSFSVRILQIGRGWRVCLKNNPDFAGKTVMLPKNEKRVRVKLTAFALGGAVFNLVYGCAFLLFYFFIPQSPVLLLFELLAPVSIFEGLIALYPAELSAGHTDGKIVIGLMKNTPYARVMQAVLAAQGQLLKGSYSNISRDLLFDLPVIREDEPLFLSLTQLRWQYCYFHDEIDEAYSQIQRMRVLCDYTNGEEAFFDIAWGMAVLGRDREGAEAFITEYGIEPSPLVRVALYHEGKEDALREIECEQSRGVKELKAKMLAESEKE